MINYLQRVKIVRFHIKTARSETLCEIQWTQKVVWRQKNPPLFIKLCHNFKLLSFFHSHQKVSNCRFSLERTNRSKQKISISKLRSLEIWEENSYKLMTAINCLMSGRIIKLIVLIKLATKDVKMLLQHFSFFELLVCFYSSILNYLVWFKLSRLVTYIN